MDNQEIVFNENTIKKTGSDGYVFSCPYEIIINDCIVNDIAETDGRIWIHIDISGTEAADTLSSFVTDVALACGLDKDIHISNITASTTLATTFKSAHGQDLSHVGGNLSAIVNHNIDATIEWFAFQINSDIELSLIITAVTVIDVLSTVLPAIRLNLMDILKESTVKIINTDSINTNLADTHLDTISVYYTIDIEN
jgi:hypothetical protein